MLGSADESLTRPELLLRIDKPDRNDDNDENAINLQVSCIYILVLDPTISIQ